MVAHADDRGVSGDLHVLGRAWPPHLHAMFGEEEAVFSIETGKVIVGKLGRKRRKMVSEWIALRRAELLENWRRGRDGLPFERVPGPENE